ATGGNSALTVSTIRTVAENFFLTSLVAASAAAAGTTQAGATALAAQHNRVTTVAASAGVRLPAAEIGMTISVANAGANSLAIYPASGAAIDAGAANAAVQLAPAEAAQFDAVTTTLWLKNAAANSEVKGADISSAATVNLDNATGGLVDVTGTTAITAITLSEGRMRTVRFAGILTLTQGASLVLPGAASITTAAGDFAIFRGYAAGIVRCVLYTRADGKAVVGSGKLLQAVNTQTGEVATGTTIIDSDDTIPQNTEGDDYMTLAITPNNANNKLLIMATAYLSSNGAGPVITGALFQDTTANALAVQVWHANATGTMHSLDITHYMTAGTTAATTFKFRAGAHVAGTTSFNGRDGLRRYGGRIASSITILEIEV
ncbi:MAG: hypothetical protein ACT4P2_12580, partial [Pseudomonadota bacterium]